MKMVREIADFAHGTVHGDAETQITTVGSLDRAGPGALAYADGKYLDDVLTSGAGCVLVPSNDFPGRTVIVVDQPRVAFANVAQWLLSKKHPFEGIHPSAIIHEDAELAARVAVGPWTVIESGVQVGSGTIIYPGSTSVATAASVPIASSIHGWSSIQESCSETGSSYMRGPCSAPTASASSSMEHAR